MVYTMTWGVVYPKRSNKIIRILKLFETFLKSPFLTLSFLEVKIIKMFHLIFYYFDDLRSIKIHNIFKKK